MNNPEKKVVRKSFISVTTQDLQILYLVSGFKLFIVAHGNNRTSIERVYYVSNSSVGAMCVVLLFGVYGSAYVQF